MGLSTRKLLVGLSAAGVVAAGFGATGQATADTTVPTSTTVTDVGPAAVTTTEPAPPTTTTTEAPPVADNPGGDDSGGEGRQQAQKVREARAAAARKAKTDGRKVTRKQPASSDETAARSDAQSKKKHQKKRTKKAADDRPATDAPIADADALTAADGLIPDAAPVGVPNFFIDQFQIPPFLLPIYQAAGIQYGIRWEILAAINEVETDYGRNLSVSSAGALGWMQFMPPTWATYGVDANGDKQADPYNPVDAIFAAARYLKAAGGNDDIRKAIFAYNHSNDYVDSVLMRARLISGLPDDLVGSLTGLTQGLFPVAAKAQYDGDDSNAKARTRTVAGNAAKPVTSQDRRSIDIRAKAGSPATAVQDGTIVALGESRSLGKFLRLRDVYGNTYTYSGLRSISAYYPVAKTQRTAPTTAATPEDQPPTGAASAGQQQEQERAPVAPAGASPSPATTAPTTGPRVTDGDDRQNDRAFAHPLRPEPQRHGGDEQIADVETGDSSYSSYLTQFSGLSPDDVRLKPMKRGAHVMAGTVLGRLGQGSGDQAPHLRFAIRPAGKGAPQIDPKPILDGWKLLESTAVYRAKETAKPLFRTADGASTGQILLMGKQQLQARVLADPDLSLPPAAQQQIRAGAIDRRVLATLEYLTANGLRVSVSSLGRPGAITSAGNVSEHASGNAVDIGSINGIRIERATQGAGSVTEMTIRLLLQLQGAVKPHQIISLMTFAGTDNTMSLPDHADHIHVGFRPSVSGDAELGKQVTEILKPGQWVKLIDRIGAIDNPTVLQTPSKYALRLPKSGD